MGGGLMKNNCVTLHQYQLLKSIGCNIKGGGEIIKLHNNDGSISWFFLCTVDEVIDWLRKKHNVVIYDAIEPVISTGSNKIHYRLKVKWCNKNFGYNGRQYIGSTRFATNLYSLKREAITLAIRWLIKNKKVQKK